MTIESLEELNSTVSTKAGLADDQSFTGTVQFEQAIIENSTAMAAADIDLTLGSVFTKTITANITLTVSNVSSTGNVSSFILESTNGGAYVITWFSGVIWDAGVAPTLTTAGKDMLAFFTIDNGTTWRGIVIGLDFK